ncbi:MAG: hypothetical protein ACK5XN_16310 [Bacteroidota bacterium]
MNEIIGLLSNMFFTLVVLNLSIATLGCFWLTSISRNPEASSKMFVPGVIILGSIELTNIVCIGLTLITIWKI